MQCSEEYESVPLTWGSCRTEAEEILRNPLRKDVGGFWGAGTNGKGLLLWENWEGFSRMEFWWQRGEMEPEGGLKAAALLPWKNQSAQPAMWPTPQGVFSLGSELECMPWLDPGVCSYHSEPGWRIPICELVENWSEKKAYMFYMEVGYSASNSHL